MDDTEKKDISHIKLVAPLNDLLRLKPFISPEEARYYLSGIHFEQGSDGVLLVATDGHRLGVFNATEAMCKGAGTVRLPARLPKLDAKKRHWLVVGNFAGADLALVFAFSAKAEPEQIAEVASLRDAVAIYPDALLDVEFPNWRRVIPSELGPEHASFQSRYLADFASAELAKKGTRITLYGSDKSEPHIVSVGDSNFIGVLMPIRANGLSAIPGWLDAPKQSKRKKAA